MSLLNLDLKESTPLIDIAKGKYKLPESGKELLKAIKTSNKVWKSTR